ncbi:uncharacterized protein H6S33_008064 [Morchella sextelata]|uniref:uncharacterized protein n=1 Tax=Morchella sextelata TaxID=1174677 RepID=UPI001D0590E4|nr:uncharacterized protein H6S33_008064 [Morchella sextelata]KAH0603060.1 hypothetical protein H6S33_008064 [Morchella sextelata]
MARTRRRPVSSDTRLRPFIRTPYAFTIAGHIFSIPKDPLEAFHFLRSQIIASYVAIFEGTAGARDMVFILVSPTGPPAPPAPTGAQRIFTIDGHIFNIATDPMEAFLATRKMTLAAYHRVASVAAGGSRPAGPAGQRDMAFLSGTAALGVEEDAHLVEECKLPEEQESPPPVRNTESPPPTGNSGTEVDEVDDEDDEDYRPSSGARRRSAPSTTAPRVTTSGTRRYSVHHTVPAATTDSPPTATTSTTTPPPHAHAHVYPPNTFLGDFTDLAHARRELGKRVDWHKGKYVDGLISLGGKFAVTKEEVGKSRSQECRNSKKDVCRVLVGNDPWFSSARCGLCLHRFVGCHKPE